MPLSLAVYLQTHPYGRLDATGFPDPSLAYHLNQGENVIVDIAITDSDGNPIPKTNVENVTISIRREEIISLSWLWDTNDPKSPQIDVEDGHVYLEILKEDTAKLAGLYDIEVQLSVTNADFFDTGAQTDVMEANSTIFVRVVPVTPAIV